MDFINGVILIKEIMSLSIGGLCLLSAILIVLVAMMFGGIRLFINGCHSFSDGEIILSFIISILGLALSFSLLILVRSNNIIPLFDSFGLGLTDHTGKYKVTITADTDMNEFQERYEIIDYENGVYTIKVK